MAMRKATVELTVDKNNSEFLNRFMHSFKQAVSNTEKTDLSSIMSNVCDCMVNIEAVSFFVPKSSYEPRYGKEAIEQRRFYNIGGGTEWYHPFWQVIDMALLSSGAGIVHTLDSETPLPVEDACAKLVYSSHCIEHLTDATAKFLFSEIFRILEPGASVRFVVPDIDMFHKAYLQKANDYFINIIDNSGQYRDLSLEQNYLAQFAYPCCALSKETPELHISDEEFRDIFAENDQAAALNTVISRIPSELKMPSIHINWFNEEKLRDLLTSSGFQNIEKSAYGQSKELVMCDVKSFDYTAPEISLFMEASKPN